MSLNRFDGADDVGRLADKPVMITVTGKVIKAASSKITVHLHRSNRMPSVLSRSFLTVGKDRPKFFGWMPVDLSQIGVTFQTDQGEEPISFTVRRLSYIELFIRLLFFSPVTIRRALGLLVIGNVRGFQFRIVRLLDSMIAPQYMVWRNFHVGEASTDGTENGKNLKVLYSIDGVGQAADASRRSMRNQIYKNLEEIAAPSDASDLKDQQQAVWMRIPAGTEFDRDYVCRLVEPLDEDEAISAVYCDEDYFDPGTGTVEPFFKPAFNAPLAESGWLAPDGALIRVRSLPDSLELAKTSMGNILVSVAKRGQIAHLPLPLFHRAEPRTLRTAGPILRPLRNTFKISVVVPTRDRADLMARCLRGLFQQTSHVDLDVIVIDNDSRDQKAVDLLEDYETKGLVRRLVMSGAFNFARACNIGVNAAKHELVLLLNNDVEPLHPEWLGRMAEEMEVSNVGACGALLLFPDGFIQHGGVTLGAGSVARHSFHFRHPKGGEDFGLIAQKREVSAVTAACLLTRKTLWEHVGGMNEQALTVAFNDVDYCLKLLARNKKIIWTPEARLTHLESVSRRADDTPEKARRFADEERYMHEHWGPLLQNDPYYNPNLSLFGGDFVLDAQPRDTRYRTPDVRRILERTYDASGLKDRLKVTS